MPGELAYIWFRLISATINNIFILSSFENKSVDKKAFTSVLTLNYKKTFPLKMISPVAKFIIILNDDVITVIKSINSKADKTITRQMSKRVKGHMRSFKIHFHWSHDNKISFQVVTYTLKYKMYGGILFS